MTFDPRHSTWASSGGFVPRTFVQPFARFASTEASSGVVLLVAALVALVWANSPWSDSYFQVFDETRLVFAVGPVEVNETLGHFINDGLMAVFFFVVGMEIKRELVVGELRDSKAAALPAFAALGGMAVPALIYLWITSGLGPEVAAGWGIPMATDIAFTLGVVALLGSRVPAAARVFILALAIADDLGAILVIALFYTSDLSPGWLALAVAGLAVVWGGQRAGVRSLVFYVPMAGLVWLATLESGIHATLAGVALGFLTPARSLYSADELEEKAREILDTYPMGDTPEDEEKSDHEAELLADLARESIPPLNRLENRLVPWSSFVIVPLFALANAGVAIRDTDLADMLLDRVALGVALGLVIGKFVGITFFSLLTVRLGWGRLPQGTTWRHIVGLALLAGIGFTVSLFITNLAFDNRVLADMARVGILAGSLISGLLGALLLRVTAK
ncbi:MAG: Na+/H+ antiporter NhaA [Actinomycetota bacterium]|nr:Na+/H+ antiporter NhaA [Actinomycetota bacterium]